MNARSKQRLQRFLTIADTVHDFCDLGRYPLEDPLDRRRELKERIMASMISDVYAFVRTEVDEVREHPENEEAQRLLPIYESVFEESMNIPKGMDNEETVVDIIKRSFSAYGVNYSTEGEYYKKLTLNEESTGCRISKHTFYQRKPVQQEMSFSKQESYDLFMRLFIDDIVPSNIEQDEPFDKFLRGYKDTYQEPYIGFFWYITYKFLFFWCNQS
jgi:hypothetical protein